MQSKERTEIKFFPIGDSYTIGEGTTPEHSWPAVLAKHLNVKGFSIKLVDNLSVTGYTTQNAIDNELPAFIKAKPDVATLLIGVNDWVQGVDENSFRKNLIYLIEKMQGAMSNKSNLVLITIPDFSAAPEGGKYARGRNISEGLKHFNSIIKEEASKRQLPVVEIFDLSQKMAKDQSLIAADGLHPSAAEYALWEELISNAFLQILHK